MLSRLLTAVKDLARTIWRAPVMLYRWLVEHASRVLTIAWLAGMAIVMATTVRRAIKLQRNEAATMIAKAPVNGDGPGEVVQLMDVDEMNQIEADRMHANGLSAQGDSDDPDDAKIDAARKARATAGSDVGGDAVGGQGKVVVVSKGGIAGWIKRNKGKKADPETLAWLRGEEAADGRAAYAGWADTSDGSIMTWLKDNKGKINTNTDAPVDRDQQMAIDEAGGSGIAPRGPSAASAGSGAGGGSAGAGGGSAGAGGGSGGSGGSPTTIAAVGGAKTATTAPGVKVAGASTGTSTPTSTSTSTGTSTGTGTSTAATTGSGALPSVGSGAVAPDATRPPPPAFELRALGIAAVAAITPTAAAEQRHAALDGLHAKLSASPALRAIEATIRDRRIVIGIPNTTLFGSDAAATELTPDGKALVQQLAALLRTMGELELEVRADPDRALELASVLVVSGVDPERLALAAFDPNVTTATPRVEILLSHRYDAPELP